MEKAAAEKKSYELGRMMSPGLGYNPGWEVNGHLEEWMKRGGGQNFFHPTFRDFRREKPWVLKKVTPVCVVSPPTKKK